jgi:uncharacterized protein (TIGR00725 family)
MDSKGQSLTICLSGAARGETVDLDYKIAFEIGKKIAERGHTLITGATVGLPDWAAQGAKSVGGKSIGISPAANLKEHVRSYHLPTEAYDFILYTGMNYVGRDALLIQSSDCVISIGGRMGTVHEFATALEAHKPVGVVSNSGGTSDLFDELMVVAGMCKGGVCTDRHDVFFEEDIDKLLDKVIDVTLEKFWKEIEPKLKKAKSKPRPKNLEAH